MARQLINQLDPGGFQPVYHLPLIDGAGFTLERGAGLVAGARAGVKRQQRILTGAAPGTLLAADEIEPVYAFNGETVLHSALVESVAVNALANANDVTLVPWLATTCNRGPKNQVDPFGVANEAQVLTPTAVAPAGGFIAQGLAAVPAANEDAVAGCWMRSVAGAHQAALVISDQVGAEAQIQTVDLVADWQYVATEHTFSPAAVGVIVFLIYPDWSGATLNPAIIRLPFLRTGNLNLTTPCLINRVGEELQFDAAGYLSGMMGSASLWFRPHFEPGDGIAHTILRMSPINANAASLIRLQKTVANNLELTVNDGGGAAAATAAVNAGNFARSAWHHLGISWSAARLGIVLDGAPLAQAVPGRAGDQFLPAGSILRLGEVANSADGLIRGLKIWTRNLSDEYLSNIYESERNEYGV